MSRPSKLLLIGFLFVLLVAGLLILREPADREGIEQATSEAMPAPPPAHPAGQPKPTLFGEKLLENYGRGSPEQDLLLMDGLIRNYRILAKGMDARHFSSNEAIASTLRGEQSIALKALPADHRIFDSNGFIIDRWGTSLFFHLESKDHISIYSSGPDKELGTDDDYLLIGGVPKQGKAEF
ncbi:MAG: hypothetical protein KJT03_06120 [Verrucomicrobiae bacterium]|nr:hypothetical protein [Verrucomicrobiae bacterium]